MNSRYLQSLFRVEVDINLPTIIQLQQLANLLVHRPVAVGDFCGQSHQILILQRLLLADDFDLGDTALLGDGLALLLHNGAVEFRVALVTESGVVKRLSELALLDGREE